MRIPAPYSLSTALSFVRSLKPSDRVIVVVLSGLLLITAIAGILSLFRSFQVEVPAYGGSLNEGVIGSPRFPNPLIAISEADRDIVALTYAGLMGYDSTGELIPVLAESYTRSEDGLTYTFILRENVRFSDGTPVTADDVLFTIARVQDPDLMSPLLSKWAGVRAEAIDARTVQLTLPRAYAPFIYDATLGILPRHIWLTIENDEVPFSEYTAEPVGAGPFVLHKIVRDSEGGVAEYRLTAFDDYALGRPYLDTVTLSFFDDQAALRAALASDDVTSAAGAVMNQTVQAPYARVFATFFNASAYTPLESLDVRRALSIAIDRTAVVEELFGGFATPATRPLPPQLSESELPTADAASRLEAARAALDEAGWSFDLERSVWTKDGADLAITLTTSSNPELRAVAGQVEKDWEALGVPTEIVLYDPGELAQRAIRPRAYQALLFGEIVTHPADLYAFWASTEREDPGLNITQFGSADVDRSLAALRAGTAEDPASLATSLADQISAAYPAAFLYTPHFLYSVPGGLRGVALQPVTTPSDRFRGIYSWYRYTEHVWPLFVR